MPFWKSYPELAAKDVAGKSFDYVVVGGGTAGCVIASRLSEQENVSVLVLERGKVMDTWISRSPLASQDYRQPRSQGVWRPSVPLRNCNNRIDNIWVAEALGGSSRINAMLYTRGPVGDYNHWRDMGHPDWGYSAVEPYFIKSERSMAHPKASHRGHNGPFETRQDKHPFLVYEYCAKVAEDIGLPMVDDANSPFAPAIGHFNADHAISSTNQRISAYTAFLPKTVALQRRDHLAICTGTRAIRLEFNNEASRVTGVHFKAVGSKGSPTYFVSAKREVIVCSGAIGSPQLLMLSGIGPRRHLEDTGIKVVRDMPGVGSNLTDHHALPMMAEIPLHETYHQLLESIWLGFLAFLQMLIFGTGLLGTTSPPANIFIRTDVIDEKMNIKALSDTELDSTDHNNVPDLELMLIAARGVFEELVERSCFSFFATLVQPRSRGTVRLAKEDPEGRPDIDLNMLSDPRDLITARKSVRFTMDYAARVKKAGYPHSFRMFFSPAGASGRSQSELSDEEIDAWIRDYIRSALHYSCTCRMASPNDPISPGVVDDKLKVHGFHNLRIADTSVFPEIPSAHTMAPALMVAERCADFVKKDWDSAA